MASHSRTIQAEADGIAAHPDLQAGLEKIATTLARPKGTVLFRQGEAVRGVFLLQKGRVRLSLLSASGEKLPYRTVGPGYILGLPATLCDKPYSLTAENLEDSQLAFVGRKDMMELLRKRCDLCLEVVKILSWEVGKLRKKQARIMARSEG